MSQTCNAEYTETFSAIEHRWLQFLKRVQRIQDGINVPSIADLEFISSRSWLQYSLLSSIGEYWEHNVQFHLKQYIWIETQKWSKYYYWIYISRILKQFDFSVTFVAWNLVSAIPLSKNSNVSSKQFQRNFIKVHFYKCQTSIIIIYGKIK